MKLQRLAVYICKWRLMFYAGEVSVISINDTLEYYNQHVENSTADMQNCDMSEKHLLFLRRVKASGHILDLGCGSGRDSD